MSKRMSPSTKAKTDPDTLSYNGGEFRYNAPFKIYLTLDKLP